MPGFIHIDIKYLPKMPDEPRRRYRFVAIDRATRWVHLELRPTKSAAAATAFLNHVCQAAPFRIQKLLTDHGKEFTDRFVATGERQPTGRHRFDRACHKHGIEHRLIPPRHPQTNGMVERFNGRLSDLLQTTRFDSAGNLQQTLEHYCLVYNHHLPQRALGHRTPIQALQQWQQKRPDLFPGKAHDHAGPDNYVSKRGRTFVLAAKPQFKQLAHNDLDDGSLFNVSPAIAGRQLLLRSDRFLYCVGKK